MESWVMPLVAVAGLSIMNGLVLFLVLKRLGSLYVWLYGVLPAPSEKNGLSVGSRLPEFVGVDQHGNRWTQEELRGAPHVLVFLSANCHFCDAVVPFVHQAAEQYSDRLHFVFAMSERPEAAARYIEEQQIRLPVVTLATYEDKVRFQVSLTPFAFGIDADGVIRAKGVARSEMGQLQRFVEPLVGRSRDRGRGVRTDPTAKLAHASPP